MPNLPKPRLRRPGSRSRPASHHAEPEVSRVETVDGDELRWVNIERPRQIERAWLEEHFPQFHPLDYEDVFSRNQRPKIDEYPDYLFIVLHFPRFDKQVGRLNAAELDIFVGPDFLVTLPNEPLQPVEYLFERVKGDEAQRENLFGQGTGYLLYKIVDACVDASFPMLSKMGHKLDRIEQAIFEEDRSREAVREISNVKQEIINFRSIVRPQRAVMSDLERTKARYLPGELDVYFDDINDASERAWQMLEGYKETIEALEVTNESVLSHGLNDILRALTVLSVVFLPLTLIASIWGMNVRVPGQNHIEGFWIIVAVMVVILGGMITFFRRRGLL